MKNPQIYRNKQGQMVYQSQNDTLSMTYRAVHQKDGTYWQYAWGPNDSGIGVPLRAKSRQFGILAYVEKVKAAISAYE